MKELYYKLSEKLGRPPTDDEVADALADLIDYALMRAQEEQMGGEVLVVPAEANDEPTDCPCEEASQGNCAMCQDLIVWGFDRPEVNKSE